MNEIEKLLRKINKKERDVIILVMEQIAVDYTKIPGIKKLIGYKNCFRVRVGKYRIIFEIDSNGVPQYHRVSRRNDQTYENLN